MDKLKVNKKFAARYVKKKAHEERSQLREKYGNEVVDSSDSSSSSEVEDEDAEALTSDVERDFLRTLSLLKSKDPSIYDGETKFFSESTSSEKVSKKHKPMYLKDYERERLLAKGSKAAVSDSEEELSAGEAEEGEGKTYLQEQEELKASFKAAASKQEVGVAGDEEFLIPRLKTEEDKAREEQEYVQWLKGGGVELAEAVVRDLAPLKSYWTDPSLSADERFLRDYILNKGYLDTDDLDRIPRYDELVASDSETPPSDSEDEEALEEQEVFERKYNFRYEEPDAELITSYPRTLGGSVRREDDRRRVKRREREERRAKEKEVRKEEVRRLRKLQEMEVQDKLEKLAKVTGNPIKSFGLSAEDLQEDFDPASYDATMRGVFDEAYYAEGEEDQEKPVFSDMEEELYEDCEAWLGTSEDHDQDTTVFNVSQGGGVASITRALDQDTTLFNMDADYEDWGGDQQDWGVVSEEEGVADIGKGSIRRKRKRGTKLNFDPVATATEKHELESRLKGELFRYREVEPNDFGLTAEELLCSDNKELNRWVSLRKAVQYLTPEEEAKDKRLFKKKSRNWKKKASVFTSLYSTTDAEASADDRDKSGPIPTAGDGSSPTAGEDKGVSKKSKVKGDVVKSKSKKAKLKSKYKLEKAKKNKLSEARLKSYGF